MMGGLEILANIVAIVTGNNTENTSLDQIEENEVTRSKNANEEENRLPNSVGDDTRAKDKVEENKEKEYDSHLVADKVQSYNDMYDVEEIRGKRHHKGQLQYLVKWLGWPENTKTWEPLENLKSVPQFIDAFEESLRRRKYHKRKRKYGACSVQPKKSLNRSTTSYNLRQLTTGGGDKHLQSAPVNDACHSNLLTLPYVLSTDERVADAYQGKAKFNNMNGCVSASKQAVGRREENGYDAKLNEIKASDRVDANKLAMHFGDAKISVGNGRRESQPRVDSNKQAQGGQFRGAKRRNLGLMKRLQKESNANGHVGAHKAISMYGNAINKKLEGGDDFGMSNSHMDKMDGTRLA